MIQKAQTQYVSRGRSAGWAARPALLVLLVALATLAVLAVGGAREAGAQEQVAPNGRVVAWGSNGAGQTDVPAAAQGGVKAVAASYTHSLALKEDGTVVAWGDNTWRQTNVPAGLTGVKAVAAGGDHNLALKEDGTVVAWGYNFSGRLNVPAGLTGVKAVAAGGAHNLALKEDGTVVAWGYNGVGQTNVPAGLTGVKAVAAGGYHSLALKEDGTVVAWGSNGAGETNVPEGLTAVKTVAAAMPAGAPFAGHSLAVQDGTVVAWGANEYGQTDVPAAAQGGAKAVAAGGYHSLAVVGDLAAPGAVELFEADVGEGRVSLSWNNPTDSDLEAVRVLRSTSGFATSPEPDADQNRVYEGTGESFADPNLSNGTTYYYTAYARDGSGNWSARSIQRATPTAASAPNDPPAATDDAVTTDRGKAVEIGVLANDTDPNGDTLTLSRFSQPDNGTAACAESGVCTYTPKEGFTGADRFAYLMSDGRGGSDFATVRVTVRDATAPYVARTIPANGAARVAPTANVTAIFSEAMAPASVNRTTVKLVKAGTSVVVPATVTYNATTKTATLNPSRSLVKGARYKATVTVGAKDAAGNALDQSVTLAGAQPKTWSFTVAN